MDPGIPAIVHEYLTKGMTHTFIRQGGVLMPAGLGTEYARWFALPHVARFVEAKKMGREYTTEIPGLITPSTSASLTLLSYEVPLKTSAEPPIVLRSGYPAISTGQTIKNELSRKLAVAGRYGPVEAFDEEEDTSWEDLEEEDEEE